jgi:hypothetical protein
VDSTFTFASCCPTPPLRATAPLDRAGGAPGIRGGERQIDHTDDELRQRTAVQKSPRGLAGDPPDALGAAVGRAPAVRGRAAARRCASRGPNGPDRESPT